MLVPAGAFGAGTVTLRVDAGVDGLVKSDRWVPVHVRIHDTSANRSADLVVSWGDVTLSRRVSVGAGSERAFELFVRSPEPREAIRISLESDGRSLAAADATVRVLDQAETVTLCIVPAAATVDTSGCSATLTPDALPHSLRGYEVVDRVRWPGGDAGVSPDRRDALRQREMLQRLDRSGDLSLVPQPARPVLASGLVPESARLAALVLGAYACALCAIGLVAVRRWPRTRHALAVLPIAAVTGSAAVAAIGHAGPGQAVQWHHSSLLQQIPGTSVSILTSRATAVFPARDSYAFEVPLADGALETLSTGTQGGRRENEDGVPSLTGSWPLGARQAFALEGFVAEQPLGVRTHGNRVEVTNRLAHPLDRCRFGDGFATRTVGRLDAGATIVGERTGDALGPLFICTMSDLPVMPHEASRPIDARGTTTVVAYGMPPASEEPTLTP